jgi:hypothetical protein
VTRLRKHPNSSDIAMEVLKSYYIPEKDVYKVKVIWWNIGKCHKPWSMGIEEKLELPAAKFREWRLYE